MTQQFLACRIILLALFGFLFSACGNSSRRSDGASMNFAPQEGIITFHDPTPRLSRIQTSRKSKRIYSPTIVISTRTEKGETVHQSEGVITLKGKYDDKQSITKMIRESLRKVKKVISPSDFRALWKSLVKAGIFKLPRYPGSIPPGNRAWIQVQSEGNQIIFLKPFDGFQEHRTEEEMAQNRAWHLSKVLIQEKSNT